MVGTNRPPPASPRLFVVIPALNEEASIGRAVSSALRTATPPPTVIVVDGGSTDATVAVARTAGAARVLTAPTPGRGPQLAAGLAVADAAAGERDVILFLHADAELPDGYAPAVSSALAATTPPRSWGCFATIDVSHPPSPSSSRALPPLTAAVLRASIAARTRLCALPYGDQAIFATAGALRSVGGVKPLPLMEDVDLVTRLRACHGRPGIVRSPVKASPRRWLAGGLVRTSLRNWSILARWRWGGVSEEVLAAEYYAGKRGEGVGVGVAVAGRRRTEKRRAGLLW